MKKSNEFGRTMLETLAFLSFMGVLAIGAIKVANSVLDKYRMSRIGTQLNDLHKNITARFMSVGKYNIDVDKLIEERVIPTDMIQSDGSLIHAYGGRARVKGENSTFKVTFLSLNRNVCIEMALLNWTIHDTTSLVSLSINDDKFIWSDTAPLVNATYSLPVTMDNALYSCEDGSENTLVWEFE